MESKNLGKHYPTVGLGLLILVGLIFFFAKATAPEKFDITSNCITTVTYHIHPRLTILINGQKLAVPNNIGLLPNCHRMIHTHEEGDGTLHIEADFKRDFSLGEFFLVWGEKLSRDQILSYRRDSRHDLTMTVNGEVSQAWENLVLEDKQEIIISYSEKR